MNKVRYIIFIIILLYNNIYYINCASEQYNLLLNNNIYIPKTFNTFFIKKRINIFINKKFYFYELSINSINSIKNIDLKYKLIFQKLYFLKIFLIEQGYINIKNIYIFLYYKENKLLNIQIYIKKTNYFNNKKIYLTKSSLLNKKVFTNQNLYNYISSIKKINYFNYYYNNIQSIINVKINKKYIKYEFLDLNYIYKNINSIFIYGNKINRNNIILKYINFINTNNINLKQLDKIKLTLINKNLFKKINLYFYNNKLHLFLKENKNNKFFIGGSIKSINNYTNFIEISQNNFFKNGKNLHFKINKNFYNSYYLLLINNLFYFNNQTYINSKFFIDKKNYNSNLGLNFNINNYLYKNLKLNYYIDKSKNIIKNKIYLELFSNKNYKFIFFNVISNNKITNYISVNKHYNNLNKLYNNNIFLNIESKKILFNKIKNRELINIKSNFKLIFPLNLLNIQKSKIENILGGKNNLKGFLTNEIGFISQKNKYNKTGSNITYNGSLEYYIKYNKVIKMMLFFDYGIINKTMLNIQDYIINYDYGLSININIMNMPILINISVPLKGDNFNDKNSFILNYIF